MKMNNLYVHTYPTFEDKLKSLLQYPALHIVELSMDNILDYLKIAKYIYDNDMDKNQAEIVLNLLRLDETTKYLIWDICVKIQDAGQEVYHPEQTTISFVDNQSL